MSRRDEAKRNNRARQMARERTAAKSRQQSPVRLSRLRVQEMADATCAQAKWIAVSLLEGIRGTMDEGAWPKNENVGAETPLIPESSAATSQHELSHAGESVNRLSNETRAFALKVIQRSPYYGQHECRSGCAYCCHTAVTIAPPEAIAMMHHLCATHSPEELADIRQRIEDNAARASTMSRPQYVAANIRCAMLTDDGNCRVHAVRPIACAGFLSLSRAACEAEFNRTPGRKEVPIDRFATTAGMSASYGLKAACEEVGVDGDFYELHHALRAIWDRFDAAEAWANGERLFEGCVRSDAW